MLYNCILYTHDLNIEKNNYNFLIIASMIKYIVGSKYYRNRFQYDRRTFFCIFVGVDGYQKLKNQQLESSVLLLLLYKKHYTTSTNIYSYI